MWEGCAKVGSVNGGMSGRFWGVDVFAFGAKEFDGGLAGDVGEADGKEALAVAENSRAAAEISTLVLVALLDGGC